jgi:phosphoribosylformylglycinamidine synthase
MIRLPLRHGEGKFVASDEVIRELEERNLVAVRYANADGSFATEFPANPNGSINSIAGICDPTGRVFGLMPHPEAFLSPYNAPDWTSRMAKEGKLPEDGDGVVFFRNAADYLEKNF